MLSIKVMAKFPINYDLHSSDRQCFLFQTTISLNSTPHRPWLHRPFQDHHTHQPAKHPLPTCDDALDAELVEEDLHDVQFDGGGEVLGNTEENLELLRIDAELLENVAE